MPARLNQALHDLFFAFESSDDPWRRLFGHLLQAALVLLGLLLFSDVFLEMLAPLVGESLPGRLLLAVLLTSAYAGIYRAAVRQQRRAPAAWASVAMVTLELCLLSVLFPYLYLLAMKVMPRASLAALSALDADLGAGVAMVLAFLLFSVKGWMRYTHRAAHLREATTSARLYERLAMEDTLTGLPNRRRFEARANALLQDAVPGDASAFCLLMIDVDRFKAINDTWSHDVGDEVLRTIAHRLRDTVGDAGFAARLAGDEFVVVLPGQPEASARDMARRLARAVDGADWATLRPELQASISIGVGIARAGDSLADVMRCSDQDMYAAKRSSPPRG